MKKKHLLILIILLVGVVFLVIYNTGVFIKRTEWQAVFLSNNQVYFGKLSFVNNKYLKLTNVFYLRSEQGITEQKETTDLNLIKLGSEIHGPENEMYISRTQVIFWENLRDDSKIVTIIKQAK